MDKRKNFFVEKGLQVKYAVVIAGFLTVLLFIAWGHVYYLVSNILPNILSSEMGKELTELIKTLIKVGVGYIIAVVILAVYLSHRIVGPLNRIKKILMEIQQTGNFDKEFLPRKNDELYDLLNCLDETFKKLQENRLVYRTHRQQICEKIKEIAA
ncbi:MAG: hypothetical protein AB1349_09370 [Elusimicrobiota bacterium]